MNAYENYHATRFAPDPRREVVWNSLWRYHFSRAISEDDCVLDLGCGYGNFINSVKARSRIAIDTWPEFPKYLQPGIESHVGSITDLAFLKDNSVDFAFASNVFEHVPKGDLSCVLSQLREKLSTRGRLAILQPNYYYAYREYFDDYTHVEVYSHNSMCDFLRAHDYEIEYCDPRFMPFSVKATSLVFPALIWLYLKSPIKLNGKQMLIQARPSRKGAGGSRGK